MSPEQPSRRPRRVTVHIEDRMWREAPVAVSRVRRAAALALEKPHPGEAHGGSLTVLLTSDERVRALNAEFRGKDKPTNVLSFPSPMAGYLGDVAIASGVVSREAESDGKSLTDHVAHLAVHGVLHLLGYDHESAREAEVMESLEIEILAEMGIPNPYAGRKRAA